MIHRRPALRAYLGSTVIAEGRPRAPRTEVFHTSHQQTSRFPSRRNGSNRSGTVSTIGDGFDNERDFCFFNSDRGFFRLGLSSCAAIHASTSEAFQYLVRQLRHVGGGNSPFLTASHNHVRLRPSASHTSFVFIRKHAVVGASMPISHLCPCQAQASCTTPSPPGAAQTRRAAHRHAPGCTRTPPAARRSG